MGFFDKIKSAMNAVTGGAAKVMLEYQPPCLMPGEQLHVRITAASTGGEVKSGGAFIDLFANEQVKVVHDETKQEVSKSRVTFQQSLQVAGPFTLAPNETRVFEGTVQVPPTMLPTFQGQFASHECLIRGRIEAFGNDPDSGYVPVRVGSKG
jgi:sporulation-control protein spo0M